jgi:hypothetical protein
MFGSWRGFSGLSAGNRTESMPTDEAPMVRVCVSVEPVSADALDAVGEELVNRCGEHAKGAVQ